MKVFTAVIERCADTRLYVGYVPGFAGAHFQGESLDELQSNLREVIEMLLEDGEPANDAAKVREHPPRAADGLELAESVARGWDT